MRRSIDEMFRVLRPGGVLSLSTEYRIEGPPPGIPGRPCFSSGAELEETVIGGPRAGGLLSPLDVHVSAGTRGTVQYLPGRRDARAASPHYPHIVLTTGPETWTSVHLALRKD